ncbi:hypothetical protein F1737_08925 [Methanoplanus sp. FWC-SCC4]|uniref:Uncharacterized protein n=1 Tax=Methanochimaera problematica TaxID=2609417 RepID=A0AA97FE03_9EURY|nr:hypothetical protein [Methanoplanus sp. FWC-SCC4]WOF16802.1 hypothetical protein F1737_08925 [Methanoplanus sp. FWC-SCC4]
MADSEIKKWNRKKALAKQAKETKKNTVPIIIPKDVTYRQDQIKTILKKSGVRAPWNLPVRELYAVRAIRLGAI